MEMAYTTKSLEQLHASFLGSALHIAVWDFVAQGFASPTPFPS